VNRGAIRNPQAYIEAALRRRTDRFDCCFPRGITFGDIDSFVEINGRFLVAEYKLTGQEIPTGQLIAYRALAALPQFTVWAIWTDEEGRITHAQDFRGGPPVACDELDVQHEVRLWAAAADAGAEYP